MKKMYYKNINVLIFLLTAACAVFSGCENSDNPVKQREKAILKNKHSIKIAAVSGWNSMPDMKKEGIQLACEIINKDGGILGKQLDITYFDDKNDETIGQQMAYEIASDPEIIAVIGPTVSSIAVPAALLFHYYGILMISPTATNPDLTTQGLDKVFRNIPTDTVFGKKAAAFCHNAGWEKILIYHENDSYGVNLANAFEQECMKKHIDIVDRESYIASTTEKEHIENSLTWISNFSFDAIFLPTNDPYPVISIFRKMNIHVPIIGGNSYDESIPVNGTYTSNIYGVSVFNSLSVSKSYNKFRSEFIAKYNREPDEGALQCYDAVMIFAEGIKKAGSVLPANIANALKNSFVQNCANGPYEFDKNGDIIDKPVHIHKFENGVLTQIN